MREASSGPEAVPPRGKRSLRDDYVRLSVKITLEQKRRLNQWVAETGRSEGEILRDILDRPSSWVRAALQI